MKWERVQVKRRGRRARRERAQGPGRKWGHTCNSVTNSNGRLLYVFGGFGGDSRPSNDVHVFDTTKQTWSKPVLKGTAPFSRDSHTCTTVGHKLFVFGGSDGTRPLNDLHILDTETNCWESPVPKGEVPAAREGHSSALVGNRIFVFGGAGRSPDDAEDTYFNEVDILDTGTLEWTKAATRGTAPVPRDSHTCSSYGNKFIVLGGENSSNVYLSDVYVLDTDSLVWKELKTTGQKFSARAGHTTVALGKFLFVFGGFTDRKLLNELHVLNVETGVWTKAMLTGEGPSPRFSLAGDCAEPDKGTLMFIGGCNDKLESLDDMYYLDLGRSLHLHDKSLVSDDSNEMGLFDAMRLFDEMHFSDEDDDEEDDEMDFYDEMGLYDGMGPYDEMGLFDQMGLLYGMSLFDQMGLFEEVGYPSSDIFMPERPSIENPRLNRMVGCSNELEAGREGIRGRQGGSQGRQGRNQGRQGRNQGRQGRNQGRQGRNRG